MFGVHDKKAQPITISCGNCVCFVEVQAQVVEVGAAKRGECRRYPPQIVSVVDKGRAVQGAGFPQVPDMAWCAEFRPRKKQEGN